MTTSIEKKGFAPFGLITDWVALKRARLQCEASSLRNFSAIAESNIGGMYGAGTEDESLALIDAGGPYDWALDEDKLRKIMKRARRLYLHNGHASNLVDTYSRYVMGSGVTITPTKQEGNENAEDSKAAMVEFKKFWHANKMQFKKYEIVRRLVRDGEEFIRYFSTPDLLKVRFVDPLFIRHKTREHGYGIETNPEDIEDVIAYHWYNSVSGNHFEIEPEDMLHVKLCADSTQKRGVPMLFRLMRDLQRDEDIKSYWLSYIALRLALTWVYKRGGLHDAKPFTATTGHDDTWDNSRMRMMRAGSVATIGPDDEVKAESPKIQDADASALRRTLILSMATASGLSEVLFSADASNNNYASSLTAESPALRSILFVQEMTAHIIADIYERYIHWGKENGTVKANISDTCDIKFPPLESRDVLKQAQSNNILSTAGVMSDDTWAARAGLELEVELGKMERQSELMKDKEGE